MSRSNFAWISDLVQVVLAINWPVVGGVLASAGVMGYLAALSTFLDSYGPIAWGIAALLGALGFGLVYALAAYGKHRRALARFADRSSDTATVNALDDHFTRKRISLNEFYHPSFRIISAAKFQDCELYGPAAIFMIGCKYSPGTQARECDVVIVTDDEKTLCRTATRFQDCVFERCCFYRATILMRREQLAPLRAIFGDDLNVISEKGV